MGGDEVVLVSPDQVRDGSFRRVSNRLLGSRMTDRLYLELQDAMSQTTDKAIHHVEDVQHENDLLGRARRFVFGDGHTPHPKRHMTHQSPVMFIRLMLAGQRLVFFQGMLWVLSYSPS